MLHVLDLALEYGLLLLDLFLFKLLVLFLHHASPLLLVSQFLLSSLNLRLHLLLLNLCLRYLALLLKVQLLLPSSLKLSFLLIKLLLQV